MKEKKYDSIVDLCSQQIEKGLCGTSPTSASHCIIEVFTACIALPLDPIYKKNAFLFHDNIIDKSNCGTFHRNCQNLIIYIKQGG